MGTMKVASALVVVTGLVLAVVSLAEDVSRPTKKGKRSRDRPQPVAVEKDWIDKQCAECIDRDSTTAGMTRCSQVKHLQRTQELDQVSVQLADQFAKRFDADVRDAFFKSQKRWEQYRDAQFKLIDKMYDELDGTMYIPLRVFDKTQVVKQRTDELRDTLNLLESASTREEGNREPEIP